MRNKIKIMNEKTEKVYTTKEIINNECKERLKKRKIRRDSDK